MVWNVFATPALSLQPIESCFLVVGLFEATADIIARRMPEAYAQELRAANHDVYVGGVAAYSTLGWFDDPVLNTMLYWDDRRLARLIFHELTHQLLYVKHDALFNESFATNFAEIGLQRWLASRESEKNAPPPSTESERAREIDFISMIQNTQQQLAAIYESKADDTSKLQRKAAVFSTLGARICVIQESLVRLCRLRRMDG